MNKAELQRAVELDLQITRGSFLMGALAKLRNALGDLNKVADPGAPLTLDIRPSREMVPVILDWQPLQLTPGEALELIKLFEAKVSNRVQECGEKLREI